MVAGVASDEQDVDRPVASAILIHHRIDRRTERRDAATLQAPGFKDRGEMTDENVISRQVGIARRRRAPAYGFLYAPRQFTHEAIAVADRIKIIQDIGAMMFNLRDKDVFQR